MLEVLGVGGLQRAHAFIGQASTLLLVHQHRLVGELDPDRTAGLVLQAQGAGGTHDRAQMKALILELQVEIARGVGVGAQVHALVKFARDVADRHPGRQQQLLVTQRHRGSDRLDRRGLGLAHGFAARLGAQQEKACAGGRHQAGQHQVTVDRHGDSCGKNPVQKKTPAAGGIGQPVWCARSSVCQK